MADNIDVTPGVGKTVAADEIAGALHQRVKITVGADGTNDGDVSSANPLPVVGVVDLGANNDVTVTGTVTAELSATDNAVLDQIELNQDSQTALITAIDADTSAIATDIAALEVLQTTIAGDTTSIDSKITACNTGAIAGTVTANLSATDNAVLDTIDAVLDTIKTDTAAIVTDAAAIEVLLGTIDADTGNIATATATPSSIGNGAKDVTTAGTAEALAGSTACKKVIICAKDSNTGKIYYGGASVSATSGAFIYPGASVEIDISNLSAVYIDSAVNGEGVQYTYVA